MMALAVLITIVFGFGFMAGATFAVLWDPFP